MIYWDNAATTFPKPFAVRQAVQEALLHYGANPGRAGHTMAMRSAEKIYETRLCAANLFHLQSAENVIFTQNCTQALNFVLKGLAVKGGHFVCSALEHNAVLRPLCALQDNGICTYSIAPFGNHTAEICANFEKMLQKNTIALICTAASNVFGVRMPLKALSELAHKNKLLFVVDGAQAAGIVDLDMQEIGIDFLCVPGHKGLYGPMGTGMLLCQNDTVHLHTVQEGGTGNFSAVRQQPENYPERLESGTLNVPGILGLNAGMQWIKKIGMPEIFAKEKLWMRQIENALSAMPQLILYGDLQKGIPLLSFNIRNKPSEAVAQCLSDFGIAVRAGLHCAPLAHETFGTSKTGTVRICPSAFTTQKDVNSLLNSIFQIAKDA